MTDGIGMLDCRANDSCSQDQCVVVIGLLALAPHEMPGSIDIGSNNQDSEFGLIFDIDNYSIIIALRHYCNRS